MPLDEEGNPLDASPLVESEENAEDEEAIPGLVGDDDNEAEGLTPFSLTAPEFDGPVPTPEIEIIPEAPTPRSRKRKLREENSALVRSLAHKTRQGHAQVNAELNRRVGIKRITEATVAQLDRRRDVAKKWLERL